MEYKGKLYGKVGNVYFPLEQDTEYVKELENLLNESIHVIAKLKRSMLVHPDCVEDSEFDTYTDVAQDFEDKATKFINSHN